MPKKYQSRNKIEQQKERKETVIYLEVNQYFWIFSTQTNQGRYNLSQKLGLINNYEKKVNYEN